MELYLSTIRPHLVKQASSTDRMVRYLGYM